MNIEQNSISDPNKKRLRRQAFLRRQNLEFATQMEEHIGRMNFSAEKRQWGEKLIGNLRGCLSHGLFRQFKIDGALSYIGGQTCKNKFCQVCNSERKRKLRGKYWRYFDENEAIREENDFFHLTLTVPHRDGTGWRGTEVYATELIQRFNFLRKKEWWSGSKKHGIEGMVSGGEYCVEFTRNENGFHTHIHALVLAKKGLRNRNRLYTQILRDWNRLTIDEGAKRQSFGENDRKGIRKSLSSLNDSEFDTIFSQLDPRGSTLVGLESLYVISAKKQKGYHWCKRLKTWKRYVGKEAEDMMRGIVECLKYHFEPLSMKLGNDIYDVETILELGPTLHRKRLYGKFGCFYGVKELNISDSSSAVDDFDEALEEAPDLVVHPELEVMASPGDYHYITTDVANAWLNVDGLMVIRGPTDIVLAGSARAAIKLITQMTIGQGFKSKKFKQAI